MKKIICGFLFLFVSYASAQNLNCDIVSSYYNEMNFKRFSNQATFIPKPENPADVVAGLHFSSVSQGVDVLVRANIRDKGSIDISITDNLNRTSAESMITGMQGKMRLNFSDRSLVSGYLQNTATVYCYVSP